MSRLLLVLVGFAMMLAPLVAQEADTPSPSALETKKKGWLDLIQHQAQWTRVPLGRAKLSPKNPWRFEEDDTLSCAGVGVHEMFLYSPSGKTKIPPNNIFHVEWRLKKPAGATAQTGILTRTLDGLIYHEALFGNKSGGYFVGTTVKDGKNVPVPKNAAPGPMRVLEAGEWNICEITSKDKTLACWVNGYVTGEFIYCEYAKGLDRREGRQRQRRVSEDAVPADALRFGAWRFARTGHFRGKIMSARNGKRMPTDHDDRGEVRLPERPPPG